jgi:hypothetical protein
VILGRVFTTEPTVLGHKFHHFLNPCNHRSYPAQLKLIGMSKQP